MPSICLNPDFQEVLGDSFPKKGAVGRIGLRASALACELAMSRLNVPEERTANAYSHMGVSILDQKQEWK